MTAALIMPVDTFWLYTDGWEDEGERVSINLKRKVTDGPTDGVRLTLPFAQYQATLFASEHDGVPTLLRLESIGPGAHYYISGTTHALAEFAALFDKG